MQLNVYNFSKRLIVLTFAVQQQLVKGHQNFDFPPAYIIAFQNFDFRVEKMQIILLELPRVTKESAKNGTRLQRFCYYMRNMTRLDDIQERKDDGC